MHGSEEPQPWIYNQTVGGALAETARRFPEHDALVFPASGTRMTWAELDHEASRIAASWLEIGLKPGEHVGIWSMNVPEWVVAQFACARIGAILVNINPSYRQHELEGALATADIATLVVGSPYKSSNFTAMVESLCPEIAGATDREWTSPSHPRLRRVIALGAPPGPGWRSWRELATPSEQAQLKVHDLASAIRPGDIHNIQFTSGTTGMPKGAMLTHHNILMNAYHTGHRLRYGERDRICVPVPFYHCFGCVLGTMVAVVHGAAVVVPAPSFDPLATLKAMNAEKCSAIYGVPTMYSAILDHPRFAEFDLTSLRTGIMSGAPCPLPLMNKVESIMGVREICIGYGQTEASPIITFTSVDDPTEVRVGTVGRPIPGLQVELVESVSREPVSRGSTGELRVRGHCVMAGYYKNPEATARAIDSEGWLYTGDLAREREDGCYRIVGRSKEVIIRGGENIYPAEVEEFLHHHPAVAEVAVAGLPDAHYGEVVAAWVVLKPSATATADDLKRFCHDQIARFKVPRHVMIVPELPKTVTGKVKKHILREGAVDSLDLAESARVETA